MDRDEIVNKRVARIARDHGCTVAEVNMALDAHPIEIDRDKYLRRTLALELARLDELEEAFHGKAVLDRDTAAGALLVKIYERRATPAILILTLKWVWASGPPGAIVAWRLMGMLAGRQRGGDSSPLRVTEPIDWVGGRVATPFARRLLARPRPCRGARVPARALCAAL